MKEKQEEILYIKKEKEKEKEDFSYDNDQNSVEKMNPIENN
jgi:hypothetical protein